ncbi:GGDEF domain-containing protein [Streptomyces sp. NPDC001406]|uniref:GGDEF domain-containing protein n=1 Tax=Streptomyces sp. NPDC001406 TaxID=3364572 RepID=UPI003693A06F
MKILFVAANAQDTGRLALDEEIRSIEGGIFGSRFADRIELIPIWAARPDDLLRAMNDHAPEILHFSGHGSRQGISLVGNNRQALPVTQDALLRLLKLDVSKNLKAVLLNSCYSEGLAKSIRRIVGCAIGTMDRWDDEAAEVFAAAFYRALAYGATIHEAVEQACTRMALEGYSGVDDMRLHATAEAKALRPVMGRNERSSVRAEPALDSISDSILLLNESECADFVAGVVHGAASASLTYLDVDGLLNINQVYGEHVGDLVVDECSRIVSGHTALAQVCRLRGDQFVIVQTGTSKDSARESAEKIVQQILRHDWTPISQYLHVSATGAIAHWDMREDSASLILRAVLGVKEAKRRHAATLSAAPLALPELSGNFDRSQERWQRIQQISSYLSSESRREAIEFIDRDLRGRSRF